MEPSAEYARLVLDEPASVLASRHGFRRLGSGAYREAFLGPDGFVYKRPLCSYGHHCNETERQTYLEIYDFMPDGWSAAWTTTLYVGLRCVSVQRYIPGSILASNFDLCKFFKRGGCQTHPDEGPECVNYNTFFVEALYDDFHNGNFVVVPNSDGTISERVLIDMG